MAASPPAGGAATPQAVRAQKGDTLRTLAKRLYRDERAAELLNAVNPGTRPDAPLGENAVVRLPDKDTANKWASRKGITLGFDPSQGSGTRQKRAWKAFQTGPSVKVVARPIADDAALVGALGIAGRDLGPGVVTAELISNELALREAISERIQWLGVDRVVKAAAESTEESLKRRANDVAVALKSPDAAEGFVAAVHRALVEVLAGDVLKEARRLFARAQQALSTTAQDEQGGMHLLGALKEAEPDVRIRLLTTLAVPKATAATASEALDRLPNLKSGLIAASTKAGNDRNKALIALQIPRDRIEAIAAELQPPVSPATAEMLALKALGLDATARQAQEGAAAMNSVVQKATMSMRGGFDPASALVHFKAARASVYRQRGLSLDADAFPPEETSADKVLEHALVSAGPDVVDAARKPNDLVRMGWRAVETLGPQLAEVDASALGRGVGALLARITPGPTPAPADEVKKLRPGDLMSMSGAAAARAQTGIEAFRTLAPFAAGIAAFSRFPFAQAAAPPTARLELRRRLTEGFRSAYGFPTGLPLPDVRGDLIKRTLLDLHVHASLQTEAFADAADRAARIKPLLEKGDFCEGLARVVGPARYKFRRDEMSHDAKWLCTIAWLMDNARPLPAADKAVQAVHKLLGEDGGRVLDVIERALLKRLG